MNPLISIVVPVYNVSKYLRKCLDSILAQAYTNWECILVDDGSTDDSGQICEDFNKIDRRFRVLHKSNQGVSAARNTGIKESTGEWLYFCDADDEMLSDGLRTLVHLTNHGEDIVFGGYVECNEEGNPIASPRISVQMKLTKDETIIELYQPSYSHYEGYLWCKLFKTEVIKKNDLFFKEDIYFNEDRLFIMEYLLHAKDPIIYTSTPVYRYYRHPHSTYWRLKEQWDHRFITDLRANILMYDLVIKMTRNKLVSLFAQKEIRLSMKAIQRVLDKNEKDNQTINDELVRAERYKISFRNRVLLFFIRNSKRLKKLKVIFSSHSNHSTPL